MAEVRRSGHAHGVSGDCDAGGAATCDDIIPVHRTFAILDAQSCLHSGVMRCGLILSQRLNPARQIAKRNPSSKASNQQKGIRAVRSTAMAENYSDRWETQFWGKPGGLQQGEVRWTALCCVASATLVASAEKGGHGSSCDACRQ
jgi:hypothetical protein